MRSMTVAFTGPSPSAAEAADTSIAAKLRNGSVKSLELTVPDDVSGELCTALSACTTLESVSLHINSENADAQELMSALELSRSDFKKISISGEHSPSVHAGIAQLGSRKIDVEVEGSYARDVFAMIRESTVAWSSATINGLSEDADELAASFIKNPELSLKIPCLLYWCRGPEIAQNLLDQLKSGETLLESIEVWQWGGFKSGPGVTFRDTDDLNDQFERACLEAACRHAAADHGPASAAALKGVVASKLEPLKEPFRVFLERNPDFRFEPADTKSAAGVGTKPASAVHDVRLIALKNWQTRQHERGVSHDRIRGAIAAAPETLRSELEQHLIELAGGNNLLQASQFKV